MSSTSRVRLTCPDGGACHHTCASKCWRVRHCGPLSGVFEDDAWPAPVAELHGDGLGTGETRRRLVAEARERLDVCDPEQPVSIAFAAHTFDELLAELEGTL